MGPRFLIYKNRVYQSINLIRWQVRLSELNKVLRTAPNAELTTLEVVIISHEQGLFYKIFTTTQRGRGLLVPFSRCSKPRRPSGIIWAKAESGVKAAARDLGVGSRLGPGPLRTSARDPRTAGPLRRARVSRTAPRLGEVAAWHPHCTPLPEPPIGLAAPPPTSPYLPSS